MINLIKKMNKILVFGAFVVFISGCTTINPYTGEASTSKTAAGAGLGAGLGAAGGAIIGGITGGSQAALIGAAIGAGAGGLTGAAIGHSIDRQDAELRQVLLGTGVQVKRVGNGVQLSMASDVTFATDSADIRASFYNILNSVAIVLNKYDNTSITINGYTDSTGSVAHNQELSERRAASVGAYLVSQRINPNRIFTKGFGSRNPVATNATSQGRAFNRRVVITLRPLS
jgi:outer membrane protein OmpA-like peptidoglycan-associated protein